MMIINGRDSLQRIIGEVETVDTKLDGVRDGNWQVTRNTLAGTGLTSGVNDAFTITGHVLVRGVVGVITTEVERTGAVEGKIGTETIDDLLIGVTTDIRGVAGLVWFSTIDPAVTAAQIDLGSDLTFIIGNGDDIIVTLDETPDAGVLEFYCFWKPLSADGNVSAS